MNYVLPKLFLNLRGGKENALMLLSNDFLMIIMKGPTIKCISEKLIFVHPVS